MFSQHTNFKVVVYLSDYILRLWAEISMRTRIRNTTGSFVSKKQVVLLNWITYSAWMACPPCLSIVAVNTLVCPNPHRSVIRFVVASQVIIGIHVRSAPQCSHNAPGETPSYVEHDSCTIPGEKHAHRLHWHNNRWQHAWRVLLDRALAQLQHSLIKYITRPTNIQLQLHRLPTNYPQSHHD